MGIVKRIHAHTARIANAVVPGAYLVEIFPFLNYFPAWLSKWKRDATEWHEQETEMFLELNAGGADKKGCFVYDLDLGQERHGLTKKEAGWLAGIML